MEPNPMKDANFTNEIQDEDDIDEAFIEILEKIKADCELERIFLTANRLGARQIERLANALSEHKKLTCLYLDCNDDIRVEAIPFLKKIIETHPSLQRLVLQYNKMTDADVKALAEGNSKELSARLQTMEIDLACNYLTKMGLAIAEKSLSPITVLAFRGNFIDEETIRIAEARASAALERARAFSSAKKPESAQASEAKAAPLPEPSPKSPGKKGRT